MATDKEITLVERRQNRLPATEAFALAEGLTFTSLFTASSTIPEASTFLAGISVLGPASMITLAVSEMVLFGLVCWDRMDERKLGKQPQNNEFIKTMAAKTALMMAGITMTLFLSAAGAAVPYLFMFAVGLLAISEGKAAYQVSRGLQAIENKNSVEYKTQQNIVRGHAAKAAIFSLVIPTLWLVLVAASAITATVGAVLSLGLSAIGIAHGVARYNALKQSKNDNSEAITTSEVENLLRDRSASINSQLSYEDSDNESDENEEGNRAKTATDEETRNLLNDRSSMDKSGDSEAPSEAKRDTTTFFASKATAGQQVTTADLLKTVANGF